jgi:uncharacterized protein (DUF58 family)
MIYPTRAAVILMLAGAPVGLLAGVLVPRLWIVAAAWTLMAATLMLLDAVLAASGRDLDVVLDMPGSLAVGRTTEIALLGRFTGDRRPRVTWAAIETNARLAVEADRGRQIMVDQNIAARFQVEPVRRGEGVVSRFWLRWQGPLGLTWRQITRRPDRRVPIIPDIAAVRDEAVRLFSRDSIFGAKVQRDTGEGAEYHALRDFQPGMDIRAIDWKQSAKHSALLVKEFRTERNHQIIFAIDTGRVMSEPVAGAPRIDRALNAALLLAFVSLKLGDRVGLFAFDSKVRVSSGAVTGVRGFAALQRVAATVDYSEEETNFTLGLSSLGGALERRSLIVVFTEFPDSVGAELMLENLQRLAKRHLILFVALRDEELEAMVRAEPKEAADVSRAVTAAALLHERDVVLARLRRLGAQVVETAADKIGPDVVNAYLDLKRRNLL